MRNETLVGKGCAPSVIVASASVTAPAWIGDVAMSMVTVAVADRASVATPVGTSKYTAASDCQRASKWIAGVRVSRPTERRRGF